MAYCSGRNRANYRVVVVVIVAGGGGVLMAVASHAILTNVLLICSKWRGGPS